MSLVIWDKLKNPPKWARKEIGAGRLKGMTDINPQWRIMAMTEQFGPVGIGWKYTIDKQWTEHGAGDEIGCFCNVSVFIKNEGAWSDAIPGTGGSSFVAKESKGPYTSDECYKMALTDALSVALKALGVGADIYCGAKYFPPLPAERTVDNRDPAIIDLFKECIGLEGLKTVWESIPNDKRAIYANDKDAAKVRLSNAKTS